MKAVSSFDDRDMKCSVEMTFIVEFIKDEIEILKYQPLKIIYEQKFRNY